MGNEQHWELPRLLWAGNAPYRARQLPHRMYAKREASSGMEKRLAGLKHTNTYLEAGGVSDRGPNVGRDPIQCVSGGHRLVRILAHMFYPPGPGPVRRYQVSKTCTKIWFGMPPPGTDRSLGSAIAVVPERHYVANRDAGFPLSRRLAPSRRLIATAPALQGSELTGGELYGGHAIQVSMGGT